MPKRAESRKKNAEFQSAPRARFSIFAQLSLQRDRAVEIGRPGDESLTSAEVAVALELEALAGSRGGGEPPRHLAGTTSGEAGLMFVR
jgi:hypothetical protein